MPHTNCWQSGGGYAPPNCQFLKALVYCPKLSITFT